jgi:ABC-type antimicrobial peptide transport system permease subunit
VKEFEFLSETWYRPLKQDPRDYNTRVLELFVRGSEEDAVLVPSVRRAMREVDPDVPIFNVQAMTDVLRFERRVESFATLLLALFAGIGIVLAAVGIYGILSYTTGRRAREIGLRVALGASRRARTLKACGSGLAVGFAGAAFLAVVLESLVVEVQPFSPGVYGVAVSAALAVAVVAGVGPVLKALRIHPRTALAGD